MLWTYNHAKTVLKCKIQASYYEFKAWNIMAMPPLVIITAKVQTSAERNLDGKYLERLATMFEGGKTVIVDSKTSFQNQILEIRQLQDGR